MNTERLQFYTTLNTVMQTYLNKGTVSETQLDLLMETLKKAHDRDIEDAPDLNQNQKDCEKHLFSATVDNLKRYIKEHQKTKSRLTE